MSDIYQNLLEAVEFTYHLPKGQFAMYNSNAAKHYIIVSDEGTSEKPRKHPTYQAAVTEAERLAKLKPGFNFVVYEAKISKNTSATPVNTLTFY